MNAGLEAARCAPRCGARTRWGRHCRKKPANGTPRCERHGGGVNAAGRGSGAPKGNSNARKHGMYSQSEERERAALKRMIKIGKLAVKAMAGRQRGG